MHSMLPDEFSVLWMTFNTLVIIIVTFSVFLNMKKKQQKRLFHGSYFKCFNSVRKQRFRAISFYFPSVCKRGGVHLVDVSRKQKKRKHMYVPHLFTNKTARKHVLISTTPFEKKGRTLIALQLIIHYWMAKRLNSIELKILITTNWIAIILILRIYSIEKLFDSLNVQA